LCRSPGNGFLREEITAGTSRFLRFGGWHSLKGVQNFVGQKGIEVIGNLNCVAVCSQATFAITSGDGNEASHRHAALRDRDLFACGNPPEQLR